MRKRNTLLEKRLFNYSLMVGATLGLSNDVMAGIVKPDTDPEYTMTNTTETYPIDFNNDGNNELTIRINYGEFKWIDVFMADDPNLQLLGSTATSVSSGVTYHYLYPKAIMNSTVTTGDGSWNNILGKGAFANNSATLNANGNWGNWVNKNNHYMSVRFGKSGNDYYYGWVKMSINTDATSVTIHTYAYDDVRNNIPTPLPVELTTFKAVQLENAVKLLWETATEINNYGFEIERKLTDSELSEWETLGFIEGHGNSNSPKSYEFIDETAPADALEYRLKQIDTDGKFEYYSLTVKINNAVTEVEENNLPLEFALKQNYPNPFNPTTAINYQLPENSKVELKIFDLLGKEVATLVNREQAAGNYTVNYDASNLPSGMYIYKIVAGNFVESRKMMLIK